MRNLKLFVALALTGLMSTSAWAQRQFDVDTHLGGPIQPTMYGIFFEDINFGADGGLYAEMVENRSFEFPQRLMGWNTFGNVSVTDVKPAFERNPHYAVIETAGHSDKVAGLENRGFFGMGLKNGMTYNFSLYSRLHLLNGNQAKLRVELVDDQDEVIDRQTITVEGTQWKKYACQLKSDRTVEKGLLRIFLEGEEGVDVDHVSMMPSDNWNGLRADLVKDLEDLHPGIFRFPGGCIVEGTDLATRYQWKNSVDPVENRPLNENRWNYTFPHRLFPNYYQTYGLGFYEFFLLSEKIGAEPLPVLSCGLACQFQNKDDNKNAHVALDDLQPYIDDALDLIEFANGPTSSKWGKLRAEMGHPQPFNLKQIGIGNEQWGPLYPERLEKFVKQIRAKYPNIKICGTSGPSASGEQFDYGWEQMRKLGVDLVDEHYYMDPDWFLNNANRYDKYPRKGPKVFAGEYACHVKDITKEPTMAKNNFEAALCEAAFMTGLERNADVVYQATYAPLFAHVDGWQWRPDLIWFNNLKSVRSVNWYVQMLYGTNRGTNMLKLSENGNPVEGANGLYASAVYDKSDKSFIVKIANTSNQPQEITINFKGVKQLKPFILTTLHSDDPHAINTLEAPNNVVPQQQTVNASGDELKLTLPAKTFVVCRSSNN
ncbi:MAG: alpha-L-arabinofuranosidase C-terminal domain-containing protein [Prevotella sp.]|jgi:alpha-L-arabinofuranosidase